MRFRRRRCANNFAGFRRHIVAQTRTRLYAFVHIANTGLTPFPVAELYNIDFAQVDACARAIGENADIALGAKVAHVGECDRQARHRAASARHHGVREVGHQRQADVHIGGVETARLMSDILDLLRPGDVLTHAYSGAPNIAGEFSQHRADGKLLRPRSKPSGAARLRCRSRRRQFRLHGVRSRDAPGRDAGHHLLPTFHVFSGNSPGMPYLPW